MRRLSCTFGLGIAILLFGVAGPAHAIPITYTQTGTASGMVGGLIFTDAFIVLTATGETDNVISNPEFEEDGVVVPAGVIFINPLFDIALNITGIGLVTITDPSAIYGFSIPVDIDEDGDIDPPLVVFGTLDDPPDLLSFTGVGGTGSNSFAGYNLQTAIGPITGGGGIGHPPSESINTNLGVLTFTANIADIDSSSGATFTATTTSSVPEPGSLLLLGTGVVSFIGVRARLRRRRSNTSK